MQGAHNEYSGKLQQQYQYDVRTSMLLTHQHSLWKFDWGFDTLYDWHMVRWLKLISKLIGSRQWDGVYMYWKGYMPLLSQTTTLFSTNLWVFFHTTMGQPVGKCFALRKRHVTTQSVVAVAEILAAQLVNPSARSLGACISATAPCLSSLHLRSNTKYFGCCAEIQTLFPFSSQHRPPWSLAHQCHCMHLVMYGFDYNHGNRSNTPVIIPPDC